MGVIFLEGASESGHVVLVFRTRPALPRIQRMCPVGLVCRDRPSHAYSYDSSRNTRILNYLIPRGVSRQQNRHAYKAAKELRLGL